MEATYNTTITLRVPVEVVAEIDETGLVVKEIYSFDLDLNGDVVMLNPSIVSDEQMDLLADDAPSYEDLCEDAREEEADRRCHEKRDASLE